MYRLLPKIIYVSAKNFYLQNDNIDIFYLWITT